MSRTIEILLIPEGLETLLVVPVDCASVKDGGDLVELLPGPQPAIASQTGLGKGNECLSMSSFQSAWWTAHGHDSGEYGVGVLRPILSQSLFSSIDVILEVLCILCDVTKKPSCTSSIVHKKFELRNTNCLNKKENSKIFGHVLVCGRLLVQCC